MNISVSLSFSLWAFTFLLGCGGADRSGAGAHTAWTCRVALHCSIPVSTAAPWHCEKKGKQATHSYHWWEGIGNILKIIFQAPDIVLYLRISFSDYLHLLPTFEKRWMYYLLLTFKRSLRWLRCFTEGHIHSFLIQWAARCCQAHYNFSTKVRCILEFNFFCF